MTTKTIDFHGHVEDPPIEPGDIVLTASKIFVCEAARPVESKLWPDRWKADLREVGRRDEHTREVVAQHAKQGVRCLELGPSYQRGEKPWDDPCDDPRCKGCRR